MDHDVRIKGLMQPYVQLGNGYASMTNSLNGLSGKMVNTRQESGILGKCVSSLPIKALAVHICCDLCSAVASSHAPSATWLQTHAMNAYLKVLCYCRLLVVHRAYNVTLRHGCNHGTHQVRISV